MNQTPIESWIETWGTNLDWEAKAKLREAAQAEKISTLKERISKQPIPFRCNLFEMDLSEGVYILVEPSQKGSGCDVSISIDGHRYSPPEATALDLKLAVLRAIELCDILGLPREHWFATKEAMIANMDKIPEDARKALELVGAD